MNLMIFPLNIYKMEGPKFRAGVLILNILNEFTTSDTWVYWMYTILNYGPVL